MFHFQKLGIMLFAFWLCWFVGATFRGEPTENTPVWVWATLIIFGILYAVGLLESLIEGLKDKK